MDDKPKNDKLKNDAPRINNVLFLVLWIAGHAGAWVLALGINKLLSWLGIYIYSELTLGMLMALGTGIPTAIVQLFLVERGLKKSMRGWLPVSIAGWAVSGLAFFLVFSNMRALYDIFPGVLYFLIPRLMFLPLFVPVAVMQWLWLRRKVKAAGLWIMAALAGALLFAVPNGGYIYGTYSLDLMEYVLAATAALLYSGSTGATMLYLWTQQRDQTRKSAALAQQSDATAAQRLERLHDVSDDGSVPEIGQETLKVSRS